MDRIVIKNWKLRSMEPFMGRLANPPCGNPENYSSPSAPPLSFIVGVK